MDRGMKWEKLPQKLNKGQIFASAADNHRTAVQDTEKMAHQK